MKKFILFCLLLFLASVTALWAQKAAPAPTKRMSEQEAMEQAFNRLFEMQRQMADQMMKRFHQQGSNPGMGLDDDEDMSQMIQKLRQGVLGGEDVGGMGFTHKWEEKENERQLIITPDDPNNKLDLDINKERVKISGKIEEKIENNGPHGKSISKSMRSFSSSIAIPYELDGEKVQMESRGNDIVMKFPFRSDKKVETKKQAPPKKDSFLKPLEASPEDISL